MSRDLAGSDGESLTDGVEIMASGTGPEREAAADRAAGVLDAGGIVVHPTETVYGLGGDGSPRNNRAISRLKGRSVTQPLLLLIPDLESLRDFLPGIEWPEPAEALAGRFWPGPLTLVLPCANAPEGLAGPDGGVGVRISPHPVVQAVLGRWGRPMTSTSANRSGDRAPRTLDRALLLFEELGSVVAGSPPVLGLDAGPTGGDRASTVVALTSKPPRLLRRGPISAAEISRVIPELEET